jgi:HD superfamily phosphohydrolase
MDFLATDARPKTLRTRLYGDQQFSKFELELLHTPILQRLYNLKQLGFADRVFPDAVHSRFNHVLGVTEVVERMVHLLTSWLHAHAGEVFVYAELGGAKATQREISGTELASHLAGRLRSLRLMALLHDLTHAAYGHTLEDEVNVFDEKHDDPARQVRFFDALTAQLLYLWSTEAQLRQFDAAYMQGLSQLRLSEQHTQEMQMAEELRESLSDKEKHALAERLRELEFGLRLLLRIDFVHDAKRTIEPPAESLLVERVAACIAHDVPAIPLLLNRDVFMLDLVGNTICADLLDYARRDAENAGLKMQFDDRFLRYLGVVSVAHELSPTRELCIRTAIQIFTDKIRHDVLSEMSAVLKARYLINERVLLHPTKCAAGAMLGTAVQLLGLHKLPDWMQVLGDGEFTRSLMTIAESVETLCKTLQSQASLPTPAAGSWRDTVAALWPANEDTADIVQKSVSSILAPDAELKLLDSDAIESVYVRAHAARTVLWKLAARRFPKLAYRLRDAHHTGGETDETIANQYSRPADRFALERKIERLCNLPVGSVFVHCPRRKTSMKVAEALVVGQDLSKAAHLREVTKVSPEGLKPYQDEIKAVENMYRSIWQFHAYLDPTHWDKHPVVDWAFQRELKFPNDALLTSQFVREEEQGPYHLLASELLDEIAAKSFPKVIQRFDQVARMRGNAPQDIRERLRAIIREVSLEEADVPPEPKRRKR